MRHAPRAVELDFDFNEMRQRASGLVSDVRACALCGEMQPSLRRLEVGARMSLARRGYVMLSGRCVVVKGLVLMFGVAFLCCSWDMPCLKA